MKVSCPESSCQAENDARAQECRRCGTPLQSYVRLLQYPAQLFNAGLLKARNGSFEQARDLFAAVVYWCPKDIEARNALALACFELHDLMEAQHQWKQVLAQSPTNVLALQGIKYIEAEHPWDDMLPGSTSSPPPSVATQMPVPRSGKKGLFRKRKSPQRRDRRR
ncbi:hypothetical protein KSC_057830 [Ktedonobacter sp. SOSP1-52]|uniref:zinc ribbon domain-containing protein n=1 Tax=Ktedonobacter sp. SOSP1-52 TaxID=2778366 RepID=UPI001915526C|nr:zinc ribbon domain-containing protein [Ktedonobacter sp. SOSP1-52]GHO66891.1 hypothetical protein KSC_057830 [Ktedonobacter sp. SOSP1-52]